MEDYGLLAENSLIQVWISGCFKRERKQSNLAPWRYNIKHGHSLSMGIILSLSSTKKVRLFGASISKGVPALYCHTRSRFVD